MKTRAHGGPVMFMVGFVALCGGCGTTKQVDANAWAHDYYNQPNTAQIASIEGDNIEFTIKGAKRIALNTPVPVKSIIPRDPGVLDALGGLVGQIAPYAAMGYVGGKLADRPTTVRPEVVHSDVVTVPASP